MRARACSFSFMSAWMYAWVDLVLSWPSQSARTAMSTPACSRLIAVEWRRGCGEIFFVASDGQVLAASAWDFVRRAWMARGGSGPPPRGRDQGGVGAGARAGPPPRGAAG